MLILGGPLHGQERDVNPEQTEFTEFVTGQSGMPEPFKYVLRSMEAQTKPGLIFRRQFWVDPRMSLEVTSQAISTVLLQNFANELLRQFMEGGELVVKEIEHGNVSESGIIISKR